MMVVKCFCWDLLRQKSDKAYHEQRTLGASNELFKANTGKDYDCLLAE